MNSEFSVQHSALAAVERLIAQLAKQNRWTLRYTLAIIEIDVFNTSGVGRVNLFDILEYREDVTDLMFEHGGQAIIDALRSIRQ